MKIYKKIGSIGAAVVFMGFFAPVIPIVVSSLVVMAIGFSMLLICLAGTILDKLDSVSIDNEDRYLIAVLSGMSALLGLLAEAMFLAALGHLLTAGAAASPVLVAVAVPCAVLFALLALVLFAIVNKVLANH